MRPILIRLAFLAAVVATTLWLPRAWRPKLSHAQARGMEVRAHEALASGDGEAVLRLARPLHDCYPDNPQYLKLLADAHRLMKNVSAERAALEELLWSSAQPIEACPRLGFLYGEMGLPLEAHETFFRCMELAPGRSDFRRLAPERRP